MSVFNFELNILYSMLNIRKEIIYHNYYQYQKTKNGWLEWIIHLIWSSSYNGT